MREFAEWLHTTRFSLTIQTVDWVVPLLQSLHILVIGVVFVSILMVSLRVLGRMRVDEPLAAVWQRFAPWLWGGLAAMVVTGVLLVIGEPVRQVTALSFWLKMILLVLGILGAVYFGRVVASTHVAAGERPASGAVRAVAVVTIALWLAIIFLGRAIGYDVEIWSSWSPSYSSEI